MNDSVVFWFLLWAISTLLAITFLALLIWSEKIRVKTAKWAREGKKILHELREDTENVRSENLRLQSCLEEKDAEAANWFAQLKNAEVTIEQLVALMPETEARRLFGTFELRLEDVQNGLEVEKQR